ncbi:hypothetical protein PUMCH_002193 [Australozyma saopauloensis]|uniref:Serine hydrolase domain-containing protein n=1 Tax=Australozyma saopauloensis TaxID=291208 RepID=A0AAX4H9E9_9ASCO|nr:hypothetical protein PUMCH_002193 [[Candida] saopauloensis]
MPKLLCLPGFLQSGSIFAEKSSGLRKTLSKKFGYELTYIDPPVTISSLDKLQFPLAPTAEEAQEKWKDVEKANCNRCWWIPEGSDPYVGFNQSLETVVNYIKENGPYDGIVGFSQGAAMAAIVANSIERLLPEHGPFRVAVLFSSFAFVQPLDSSVNLSDLHSLVSDMSQYTKMVKLYEGMEQYFTPGSSHTKFISVMGSQDMVVPAIRTEYFHALYPEIEVVQHDGGHYVPNKKAFLTPLVELIVKAVDSKPAL